jgi:hypothetical protein
LSVPPVINSSVSAECRLRTPWRNPPSSLRLGQTLRWNVPQSFSSVPGAVSCACRVWNVAGKTYSRLQFSRATRHERKRSDVYLTSSTSSKFLLHFMPFLIRRCPAKRARANGAALPSPFDTQRCRVHGQFPRFRVHNVSARGAQFGLIS